MKKLHTSNRCAVCPFGALFGFWRNNNFMLNLQCRKV